MGEVKLIVIGDYKLGFEVKPKDAGSNMKVFIDYALPKPPILGMLFGKMYAKWCVNQMIVGVGSQFGQRG